MAIHVQDDEADWLVRDFARRRGVGITAAIKLAIREASAKEDNAGDELARKIEPVLQKIRERKSTGPYDDKEFMDEMWGEP